MQKKTLHYCFKGVNSPEFLNFKKGLDQFLNKKYFDYKIITKNNNFGISIFLKPKTISEKIKLNNNLKGRELELQDKMPSVLKRLLK